MIEAYAAIKEVHCSALDFSVHASVHKGVFKKVTYLETWFKATTQFNSHAVKTIREGCLFE